MKCVSIPLPESCEPIFLLQEIRQLPGIGSRLAEKIVEIMETGSMTKLEEYQTDADIAVMDLFGQIWGIGPAQAKRWVDLVRSLSLISFLIALRNSIKGYRTLDDLRTKAKLTHNQMIGLKYCSAFLERIPREEVAQIENAVRIRRERSGRVFQCWSPTVGSSSG
jgi:DNA polymerase lambda